MPSFILRDLDPIFWTRVQAKAAAEGTTVKALILRLLTAWLAAAALLSTMIGCAYHAPTEPSAAPVAAIAASVPYSLMLGGVSGMNANAGHATISAIVQNINGATLSGITVAFSTDLGTLGDASVITDANGKAATTLTASDSARITATAGTVTSHVVIASQPIAPTPTLPPTAPPPTDPGAPVGPLSVSLNAVVDVTLGSASVFSADVRNGPQTSVSWTYGDGTGFTGSSSSAAHTYAVIGTYALGVAVTDGLGRRASASTTATVRAIPVVPPPPAPPTPVQSYTVTVVASPSSLVAGGTTTLTATATAVNGAPAATRYRWDCEGDGTYEFTTTISSSQICTYASAGTFNARAAVNTGDVVGTGSTLVSVGAAPPQSYTVALTASPTTVVQNGSSTLTATVTPVNSAPTPTNFAWDCDGNGTVDFPTGSSSQSCTYPTAGSFTVRVTATSGTVTGTGTANVTVTATPAPAPPSITVTCNVGKFGAPAIATSCVVAATVNGVPASGITTVDWIFGDGATATQVGPVSPNHTYPAANSYVVFATATITGVTGTVSGTTTAVVNP